MLRYWLWLSERKNIGPRTTRLLLEHFQTAEQIYLADEKHIASLGIRGDLSSLQDKDLTHAEEILNACFRKSIGILTWQDAAYPDRLRNIDDPPVVLYYRGTLPAFDAEPVIAMVGTRKASAYGMMQAKLLGYQLAKMGAIVISGGADGIDTMALKGALSAAKTTVAVLGCGVDVDYPKFNKGLFEDIRANGCLVSEYPPGTPALGAHFPVSNRLLSALSLGVAVIEAPKHSGALITAQHALEQGKDVFTIPTNIGIASSAGNIQLLKDGAIPISEGWDILKEYEHLFPNLIERQSKPVAMTLSESELAAADAAVASRVQSVEEIDRKVIDKKKTRNYIDLKDVLDTLSPDERTAAQALSDGAKHVDELVEQTQLPIGKLLSALTMLELKGIVKRLPARRFSLAEE